MTDAAPDLVTALGLEPLPVEGGLFAQSHLDPAFSAIYYLLRAPAFSGLHRLDRPELFVFHGGAPARMLLLYPDGTVTRPVLGLGGQARPQVLVPAHTWQATETLGEHSMLGTVVVPPYTDGCVEFGAPEPGSHPGAEADIARLRVR